MIILDTLLPGFGFEEAGDFSPNGIWHFSFHSVRDLPEKLIEGKEDVYLNWFYDLTYNQSAITPEDREEYIKCGDVGFYRMIMENVIFSRII
jgi:hypothetical protein